MNMKKTMVNEIKEIGFEVLAHERDSKNCFMKKIYLQREPETTRLKKALQAITPGFKIRFFDDDPDTFDEEGGYCQAIILDENTALFTESNHDWCKPWETISLDELISLMKYSWCQDDIWGKYKSYFTIEENKYNTLVAFCNLQVKQSA